MSRLKDLRAIIDRELLELEDDEKRISAVNHLYGVSMAAVLIAERRGMDPELPAMAAMMHDMNAYLTGSYDDHAHKGAELARTFLKELGETDSEETELICSMIYHHDDKGVTDQPYDEVLKDADVMHHCFNDPSKAVKDKEKVRYEQLVKEFGLQRE
ncbi:MAG: HD domain-containing protein [Solobacterium sp.]|nr:HD domain-containing protein [Solobacterium sp.]